MTRVRGQTAIEFMMIFALLVAAVITATLVSLERTTEINSARAQLEVKGMLNDISGKIDTAFLEGSGFSMKLDLPEKLLGRDYSIEIYSNSIYIEFKGATHMKHILTQNVTGALAKGENTIRNRDGVITIEN